jgi:hypothetical protein
MKCFDLEKSDLKTELIRTILSSMSYLVGLEVDVRMLVQWMEYFVLFSLWHGNIIYNAFYTNRVIQRLLYLEGEVL